MCDLNKYIKAIGKVTYLRKMGDGEGWFIGVEIINCVEELANYELTIYKDDVKLCRLAAKIEVEQLLYLEGSAKDYKETPQIKPNSMFIVSSNFDFKTFAKKGFDAYDSDVLHSAIYSLDKQLINLIMLVIGIGGSIASRYEAFINCWASTDYHRAHKGGVAAHTTNMIRLAQAVKNGALKLNLNNLEAVDFELLIVAIILHDAHKICEFVPCEDKYLRRSNVIAHQISVVMELKHINELYHLLDEDTLNRICNIILTTHAKNCPYSLEGELLSILDGLETALSRCVNDR